jgi:hypothetical protein
MKEDEINSFINGSYIGRNVKLSGDIIIHRTNLNPDELSSIKNEGKFTFESNKKICELEIDGNVIAKGKIIKKKGEYYFKTIDIKGGDK